MPSESLEAKLAEMEARLGLLEGECRKLSERVVAGTVSDDTDDDESGKGSMNEEKFMSSASRALIVQNREDPKTDRYTDFLPDGRKLGKEELKKAQRYSAFTLREKFPTWRPAEIEIHDEALLRLLRSQLKRYPGHSLVGDDLTITSPFQTIIFQWDALNELANAELSTKSDDQAHSDLRLLLNTITERSVDRRLDEYFKDRAQNMEQKHITFERLWTIFPPGERIFGRPFQKQDQMFIVQESMKSWPREDVSKKNRTPRAIRCWMYDWNGEVFQRTPITLTVEPFDGTRPIVSLPFYPLRYHEDAGNLEKTLEERGRKFRQLCVAKKGEQMFYYNGQAMLHKRGVWSSEDPDNSDSDDESSMIRRYGRRRQGFSSTNSSHFQVKGTVMIDFLSYNRYGPAVTLLGALASTDDEPDCNCEECRQNDELTKLTRKHYDKATGEQSDGGWTAEQFMLCPPRVLGYVLREKQWAQLQVNQVSKGSSENKDAYFKKLILPGRKSGLKTKQMLMNLVQNHAVAGGKDDDQVDDIIEDKGKGLVILLYGPPGVGKTSTAETVAIAAGKPLFPVSVADVGTKAKYVEGNLETIFDLATAWEAILLIDEADIFLESRSQGNGNVTERNALVSVFLRVLEYYQGILFLTTNQIAQFDVAVQSRIHVALKYEGLQEEQSKAIFFQFLTQLQDKNKVEDIEGIKEWIESELQRRQVQFDGRQIRNIVSCAMSLARAERRKLSKDDLLKVADYVRNFKTEF